MINLGAVRETKGFIGERYDTDAGLSYLNARYYDPRLGLFLQPDWWEVLQPDVGTNRYSYSFNDSVNGKDPGGHAPGAYGSPRDNAHGMKVTKVLKPDRKDTKTKSINPKNPFSVNFHALIGDGSPRRADFTEVNLNDLAFSIQRLAQDQKTDLARAKTTGVPTQVRMTEVIAARKMAESDNAFAQSSAIGRFSATVDGVVTVDAKGNATLEADVEGELDRQDYPSDPSRGEDVNAVNDLFGKMQSLVGGSDYDVTFEGSQTISVTIDEKYLK